MDRRKARTRWSLVASAIAVALTLSPAGAPAQSRHDYAGTVWEDPERFRALARRVEPWPLRDDPPPPGVAGRPCFPGEGLPVVIGEARMRLSGRGTLYPPFNARQGEGERIAQRVRALSDEAFCRSPADWATAQRLDGAFLTFTTLYNGVLDPRCHRQGMPGDPRPECDRPGDSRWWRAFVAGVPNDVTLRIPRDAPWDPKAPDEPLSGIARPLWRLPGRTLEPRPAGSWTLRDAEGRARAVVLPRLGGEEDTREPLMPSCGFVAAIGGGWLPPGTPEEEARRVRGWTSCEVRYRHRGVVDVAYRFLREVYDEPDIPALDLRVRRLVQAMLDGAEALPPPRERN